MKIVICGSMTFSKSMIGIEKELVEIGHAVVIPRYTKEYAELELAEEIHSESVKNKVEHDLIRDYFNKIKNSDAILIVNKNKNKIKNYIGGNSFLEMGFAHILNKKIFLLNSIPEMIYTDEIKAMQPIVLEGDLTKLSKYKVKKKKYTMDDFKKIQFRSKDKNLSKSIDKILYKL